jgi:hypothetical protein
LSHFVAIFCAWEPIGFGGPIALAGHTQQDLVDSRGWIAMQDYLDGLADTACARPISGATRDLPGHLRAGVIGATLVSLAFILPLYLIVLALSAPYIRYGGLPWMQGMFYGIGAAVIGNIAGSAVKPTSSRPAKTNCCVRLRCARHHYRLDFARNHLALPAGRRSGGDGPRFADASRVAQQCVVVLPAERTLYRWRCCKSFSTSPRPQ